MSLTANRLIAASGTGGWSMPQGNFFFEGGSTFSSDDRDFDSLAFYIPEDLSGVYSLTTNRLRFVPFNTPGDVNSGMNYSSQEESAKIGGVNQDYTGLHFRSTGLECWGLSQTGVLYEINLTSAWDVTTATLTAQRSVTAYLYMGFGNYTMGLYVDPDDQRYVYIGTGPNNQGSASGSAVSTNVLRFNTAWNLQGSVATKPLLTSSNTSGFFPYRDGFGVGQPGASQYTYGFGTPIPGSEFTDGSTECVSVLSAYGDVVVMPKAQELSWFTNEINQDNTSSHRLMEVSSATAQDLTGDPFYRAGYVYTARMVQGSGTDPDYLYLITFVPSQKTAGNLGKSGLSINKIRIEKHAEDSFGNWKRRYMQWSGTSNPTFISNRSSGAFPYTRRYKCGPNFDYRGYGGSQVEGGTSRRVRSITFTSQWAANVGYAVQDNGAWFPPNNWGRAISYTKDVAEDGGRYALGFASTSSSELQNDYLQGRFWQAKNRPEYSDPADQAKLGFYDVAGAAEFYSSGSDMEAALDNKYIMAMGCGGKYSGPTRSNSPGRFLMWIQTMDNGPGTTITYPGTSFKITTFIWEPDSNNTGSGDITYLDTFDFGFGPLIMSQVGLVGIPGAFNFSDNGRRCWLTVKSDIYDIEYSATTRILKYTTIQMDLREKWDLSSALGAGKPFVCNVFNFWAYPSQSIIVDDSNEYGMGLVLPDPSTNTGILFGGRNLDTFARVKF